MHLHPTVHATAQACAPSGRRFTLLAGMLLGMAALAACAGATSAPPAAVSLVGTEWQLQSINGRPVIEGSQASLMFPEVGRVAGNGSCNRFVGAVAIDEEHIVFRQMVSTRMACLGGAGEQEMRYMDALQKAQRYAVLDRQLTIQVQGMEQPLLFKKTKP